MMPAHAMRAGNSTPRNRSALGTVAVALTALSALAFALLILGSVLDWKGFSSGQSDVSTFADVTWSVFALGGILAVVAGLLAWLHGHRSGWDGDIRAGQIAVGWVALAIAISAIWSTLD
jgi:hypothetical protein